jgi:hypothetical protein
LVTTKQINSNVLTTAFDERQHAEYVRKIQKSETVWRLRRVKKKNRKTGGDFFADTMLSSVLDFPFYNRPSNKAS